MVLNLAMPKIVRKNDMKSKSKSLFYAFAGFFGIICFVMNAYADECDGVVVNSNATTQNLTLRGRDVQRCLDLSSELEKAAYQNTFGFCRNMSLSADLPAAITLPTGEILSPPVTQTWEEFAISLGESAAKSGCRDGVLSAYQQTIFMNSEKVRDIFAETGMSLENLLTGTYSMGTVGQLEVTSTLVEGTFTKTGGIRASDYKTIAFRDVPLRLQVSGIADFRTFFGNEDFELQFSVEGRVSGTLDSRTLEATVTSYEVDQVKVSEGTLFPELISDLMKNQLQAKQKEVASNASRVLTQELYKAYQSVNPFEFLSNPLKN